MCSFSPAQFEQVCVRLQSLRDRFAAELRGCSYVPRLLTTEGTDPERARTEWALRRGTQSPQSCCFEEAELDQPRITIIGNAGAGKTLTLKHLFQDRADQFIVGTSTMLPLWLDLGRDLDSSADLGPALENRSDELWAQSEELSVPVCLFLDSLDDALMSAPGRARPLVAGIENFLHRHRNRLAQVFISCRRPAWSPDWFGECEPQLVILSLDYLGSYEWEQKIPDAEQRHDFWQRCETLGVAALLRNPFDGFFLADEYLAGRSLPDSRVESFQRRVDAALSQQTSGGVLRPGAERLRQLARQLACVATFCGKVSWSQQEAHDWLHSGTPPAIQESPSDTEINGLLAQSVFYRTADEFIFSHQLLREFLVAEALDGLSARKQNQLLEAAASPGRICFSHRNIAVFLAETSSAYASHLIAHDPLVAFLAEVPALGAHTDEELTSQVLDLAISQHIAPWWDQTPEGTELRDALPRHRPADVTRFLAPYLEMPEEIALIWATECAVAWGGASPLNERLCELAHDPNVNGVIRTNAIDAIAASGDMDDLAQLYDLLTNPDDAVRGHVLRAYREQARPSPAQYIACLRGGAHQPDLLCLLETDSWRFADGLDHQELGEAFAAVVDDFEELRDLCSYVIRSLAMRAEELQFHELPPRLYLLHWGRTNLDARQDFQGSALAELLPRYRRLFRVVFTTCLEDLADADADLDQWEAAARLAQAATDDVFDLFPETDQGLAERQLMFVNCFVADYFAQSPTEERLALFQTRAPLFTQRLRLPEPPAEVPHDVAAEGQRLDQSLTMAGDDASAIMNNVLVAVAEAEFGGAWIHRVDVNCLDRALERLPATLREQVRQRLSRAVTEFPFRREPVPHEPRQFTLPIYFEPVFWYLKDRGVAFSDDKLAEIAATFALRGSEADQRYTVLLGELRDRNEALWQETVYRLLEDPISQLYSLVDDLIEHGDAFYAERCAERFRNGWFVSSHLHPLLQYLTHFGGSETSDALWACYQLLRQYVPRGEAGHSVPIPRPTDPQVFPDLGRFDYDSQIGVLLRLLEANDERGWDELAQRVANGDVPVSTLSFWSSRYWPQWPCNPQRAVVVADWYALVRRSSGQNNLGANMLERQLLSALREVGALEDALRELNRMRRDPSIPRAQWLAHEVQQVEQAMLSQPRSVWDSAELLLFLNRERYRVVNCEQDLFECLCDVVEELRDELARSDGVAAYWEAGGPKRETDCQNSLWPRLRDKLSNWDVVGAEERLVGRDLCDFWVELPGTGRSAFQVAVELKVAREGYGRADLVDPLQSQLWQQYMAPTSCRHGIYLVMWFKDDTRYPHPPAWATPDDLLEDLRTEAAALRESEGAVVACYVLDVTAQHRR